MDIAVCIKRQRKIITKTNGKKKKTPLNINIRLLFFCCFPSKDYVITINKFTYICLKERKSPKVKIKEE